MKEKTPTKHYLIGQAAKMTKINIETIRYYERVGVMPKPYRSAGNQRVYGQPLIDRLNFIRRSRELGFSLKEIIDLLTLDGTNLLTCNKVHAIASEHLKQVEIKITDLQNISRVLRDLTEQCSRGEIPDCPITEALSKPESAYFDNASANND